MLLPFQPVQNQCVDRLRPLEVDVVDAVGDDKAWLHGDIIVVEFRQAELRPLRGA